MVRQPKGAVWSAERPPCIASYAIPGVSRGIAAFKDNFGAQPLFLYPLLQQAKLDLQLPHFLS
jgi:hypothetical protein